MVSTWNVETLALILRVVSGLGHVAGDDAVGWWPARGIVRYVTQMYWRVVGGGCIGVRDV